MVRFLLSLALVFGIASTAVAKEVNLVPEQGLLPMPSGEASVLVTSQPAVVASQPVSVGPAYPICCDRDIVYRHLRPRLEPCGPRYDLNLLVKDPWECCYLQVPLCLPCCCTGEPEVCHKGKAVVEYTWCCGYKVRLILTRHGRVIVHYNA